MKGASKLHVIRTSNDIERGAYQVTERNMIGTGRLGDEMASRMPITIGEACLQASLFLEAQDVGEPRSNAELLLMHHAWAQTGRSCCVIWRDPFPAGAAGSVGSAH